MPPKSNPLTILFTVAALIGVVVLAAGGLMVLRSWMSKRGSSADPTGSLMDQLRAMHASGKLTDEEYHAARAKLRTRLAANTQRRPDNPFTPDKPTR
ncbi:hypothetical protein BH11PLA1_BH11PLA1_22570 [soil metagenome]